MNKSKKYTIIFIIVCFFGIGISRIFFFQEPITPIKENPIVEDKKEEQEDKTEEIYRKENQTESKDKVVQKEVEPKQEHTKPKKEKPKEDNVSQKNNQLETYKISLSIQGIDEVIEQGNVEITDEASVFDVLKILCDQKGLSIKTTGFGPIIYVSGINGLNEFDYGATSGWKYKVNGTFPGIGPGSYYVKDGDHIEWIYQTE